MREFLRAHRLGAPRGDVPQARFLRDRAARFDRADLPLDFVFERVRQIAERIQILHFGLRPEFRRAAQPHAHVGVAAQRAFLHVAVAHFRVFEDLLQRVEVRVGLGGRAQVRLGNDFDQRDAAAVEIDVAPAVGIGKAFVQALARVVFHVQPRDADALFLALDFDLDPARQRQRQLVHRNLVALRQIGIKVVLARKARARLNRAVDRQRRAQRQLQRPLVQHRQRPRQPQAHGTRIRIRRRAEFRRAAAKRLRQRVELRVHLEPDHSFVARHHLGRHAGHILCSLAHNKRTIIALAATRASAGCNGARKTIGTRHQLHGRGGFQTRPRGALTLRPRCTSRRSDSCIRVRDTRSRLGSAGPAGC